MALKKVIGAKAVTSKIIVEHIPAKETFDTKLIISDNVEDSGPPQAFILDMGPGIEPATVGFKIGDRVIISGKYVPLPQVAGVTRPRGVVEIQDIKAVLVEAE